MSEPIVQPAEFSFFPIAIVGMSCRFPGAENPAALWRLLCSGRDAVREVPPDRWDPVRLAQDCRIPGSGIGRWGGFLDHIDRFDAPFFGVSAREAECMDPQQRMLLELTWEALEDACIPPRSLAGTRTGVYVGIANTDYANRLFRQRDLRHLIDGYAGLGNAASIAANRISHFFDLRGPSMVVDTACSASLVAVQLACHAIWLGEIDAALVGGANLMLSPETSIAFTRAGMLSESGCGRVFDADADGYVRGEGAGMVMLRPLSAALAAGERVLAVIRGIASSQDGRTLGLAVPRAGAQEDAIRRALAQARLAPGDVSLVEAHGTATRIGDPVELGALAGLFGARGGRAERCWIGSVKANIGHLEAAAGIAGLIKLVLCLKERHIPPQIHYEHPVRPRALDSTRLTVARTLEPWDTNGTPRWAGLNSFGFGGTNVHLVLGEGQTRDAELADAALKRPRLLCISAKTDAAIRELASAYADTLSAPGIDVDGVCATAATGRDHHSLRIAAIGDDAASLRGSLITRSPTPRRGRRVAEVVFLFPGQGAQYVRMGQGLYAKSSVFRSVVDRCAALVDPYLPRPLAEVLADPTPEASPLDETLYTQPALFAVEIGLFEVFRELGVRPAAVLGHSVGEYAAAVAAGAFSLSDGLSLLLERARLVDSLPRSGVTAVARAPAERVAQAIERIEGVSIAAINGPENTTFAGEIRAVDRAIAALESQGVNVLRLPVSHAFHCELMDPILDAFTAAAARTEARPLTSRFASNLTGSVLPPGHVFEATYWTRQLRAPLQFAAALSALAVHGPRVFLELGPRPVLIGMGRDVLAGESATWIPTLRRGRDDMTSVLEAAGALYEAGLDLRWEALFESPMPRVALPSYPFERRRYWADEAEAVYRQQPASSPDRVVAAPASVETHAIGLEVSPRRATSESIGHEHAHLVDALRGSLEGEATEGERRLSARILDVLRAHLARSLGVEAAYIDDGQPLAALGVDSMMAIQLKEALVRAFDVMISMSTLVTVASLSELAERIAEMKRALIPRDPGSGPADAVVPPEAATVLPDLAARHLSFPLNDIQQAYWVGRGDAYELGGVAAHIYVELACRGLDVARFQRAWERVIARHEMLRAVVLPDGRQAILAHVPPLSIEVLDVRERSAQEVEASLLLLRERLSHQVLPTDRWPLFEIKVHLCPEDVQRVHLSLDYILVDFYSFQILARDLARFYREPDAGLAPLSLSFRDYTLALRGEALAARTERARDYWRARLDELPPPPELPFAPSIATATAMAADRSSASGTPRFGRRTGRLQRPVWEELRREGARHGLTPSSVLLAAFAEVLTAWSKSPRFTINLTTFNRLPLHPEIGEIIGDFSSLTLIGIDNGDGRPFGERAQRLHRQIWAALDHREYSGVEVMRDLGRKNGSLDPVLMPIVFTSTLGQRDVSEFDLLGEVVYGISQTPQVLLDHQIYEEGGELVFQWDAVEAAFLPGVLDAMWAAYRELLAQLAADAAAWSSRPGSLLPPDQVAQRQAYNATARALPPGLLHASFFSCAAAHPERPAVLSGNTTLTYGQLARTARQLGQGLRLGGARPDTLVAIVCEKGWQQVAAVMGVLASGAAYLPIDPALPTARLHHLLAHARITQVVTEPQVDARLAWPDGVRRLLVPEGEPHRQEETNLPLLCADQNPEHLAYVIYTSGSTGEPKGVMIDHRSAHNTIVDINERCGIGPDDRVLGVSSLSFDLSVYDLFGLLSVGGALVLPEAQAERSPAEWAELIVRHQVTLWNSVPALMALLLEEAPAALGTSLRHVLLSGDWIPVTLPESIRRVVPSARITSLGGATEASIWSIAYPIEHVDPSWRSIPYGRPLANQRMFVLDASLAERPLWVTGEIFIGGDGLARGYLHDEVRTRERFITHPQNGERLYRTGDLGRYLPSGEMEFLGREDLQVKVNGYRIELGEIESTLARHPAVAQAVAAAEGSPGGPRRLVAYVVPREGERIDPGALRAYLRERLPPYMTPAVLTEMDSLPLSANGKVDRKRLARPEFPVSQESLHSAPSSALEATLIRLFAEVLERSDVGAQDEFFALGGDSLRAVRLATRVREELGVQLPLRKLLANATAAALAQILGEGSASAVVDRAGSLPVLVRRPDERYLPFPLTDIQHAYWIGRSQAFELGAIACHVYFELAADALDVDRFEEAWNALIARHDMLRAVVLPEGMQQVLPVVPRYRIARTEVTSPKDGEDAAADAILAVRARMSHEVLDTERWPLFALHAVMKPRGRVHLHFSFDLVLLDFWSLTSLLRELMVLYADPAAQLKPIDLLFRDYVLSLAGRRETERYARARSYWQQRILTLSRAPELPVRTLRSAPSRFVRRTVALETVRWDKVKQEAGRHGLTPSTVLFTLFAEVVAAWSRAPRFTLNLTTFDRVPIHPQVGDVVGDFSTLTLVEVDHSEPVPFRARAERLQSRIWEDLDHREYSGIEVMRDLSRRDGSGARAQMPVVFTSTLGQEDIGGGILPGQLTYGISQTPQVWLDHQVYEERGALVCNWDAVEVLFEPGVLDTMVAAFTRRLHSLTETEDAWSALPRARENARDEGFGVDAGPGPRSEGEARAPQESELQETTRSPEEQVLSDIFREVLHLDRVGTKDSFFALGGDSLLAVKTVSRLRTRGYRVELHRLLINPTIAGIAPHLVRTDAEAPSGSRDRGVAPGVVCLRSGTERPALFCVHPSTGDVACYVQLAAALPEGVPVFALAQTDVPEEGRSVSFTERARDYAAAIRSTQPAGPYHLVGWSLGGALALEIAQILQREGQAVVWVAIIDLPINAITDAPLHDQELGWDFLASARSDTAPMREEQLLSLGVERGLLPADLSPEDLRPLLARSRTNTAAMRAHGVPRFEGTVLLFVAEDSIGSSGDSSLGWSRVARTISIHAIPGDHFTVMRTPSVLRIASVLGDQLAGADRPTADDPALERSEVACGFSAAVAAGAAAARNAEGELAQMAGLTGVLDHLGGAYATNALLGLGALPMPDEVVTLNGLMERAGIPQRHKRLVSRWLDDRAADGVLRREVTGYSLARAPGIEPVDALWDEVRLRGWPADIVALLRRASDQLADVLIDRVHPLQLLFDESEQLPEWFYESGPVARYTNTIMQAVVGALARGARTDHPLCVLEIGAGTGGTSASLIACLRDRAVEYLFTDVSPYFLERARVRFQAHDFVRYQLLDIERRATEQGIPAGSTDILVAAGVLHAARSVREALGKLREVMRPGGVLVLSEATRYDRWHASSPLALLTGHSHFSDEREDRNHPLFSADEWVARLTEAGFVDAAVLPSQGTAGAVIGHHVIVAHVPADDTSPHGRITR